ncbi:MAG TPA: hypothetical protein VLX85_02585 [Stellaceae bacterium]|nr:hypothetical protein [Stellaceae bacterium]
MWSDAPPVKGREAGGGSLENSAKPAHLPISEAEMPDMEMAFHRRRFSRGLLAWLAAGTLLWCSEAVAAQSPSQGSAVEIRVSSARSAVLVSACRREAERHAAPPRDLHSIRWERAAHPQVAGSRSGSRVIESVSLAGWARSGDDWVPITAQCRFDSDRRGVASVDLSPVAPVKGGLDLSEISALPQLRTQPDAALPSAAEPPPPADAPDTSGSSKIAPIFQQTAPPAPFLNKDQDFLHDHRFGIELRTPF